MRSPTKRSERVSVFRLSVVGICTAMVFSCALPMQENCVTKRRDTNSFFMDSRGGYCVFSRIILPERIANRRGEGDCSSFHSSQI